MRRHENVSENDSSCQQTRLLDAGDGDPAFLTQRVVTAHFYAGQLLPQAAGLAPAVTAGPVDLQTAEF